MELGKTEVDKVKQMAEEGHTIAQISKELGLDYWTVWDHARSWRGAKWMITNRLNRLVKEKDQAERQKLRDEANECVKYLYDAGQRLGRKVDQARKTLDS